MRLRDALAKCTADGSTAVRLPAIRAWPLTSRLRWPRSVFGIGGAADRPECAAAVWRRWAWPAQYLCALHCKLSTHVPLQPPQSGNGVWLFCQWRSGLQTGWQWLARMGHELAMACMHAATLTRPGGSCSNAARSARRPFRGSMLAWRQPTVCEDAARVVAASMPHWWDVRPKRALRKGLVSFPFDDESALAVLASVVAAGNRVRAVAWRKVGKDGSKITDHQG